MRSLHSALLQEAQQVLDGAQRAPQARDELARLVAALEATSDVHEASRLYTTILALPSPHAAIPYDPTHTSPGMQEFELWCATGRLPDTVDGLQSVETILRIYGDVP